MMDAKTHKAISLFIICAGVCCPICSQSIITGSVQDVWGKAIQDVAVVLMQTDSIITEYAMSDEQGHYRIVCPSKKPDMLLSISAFNIKRQIKRIENRTQTVDFIIEEESIKLREVLVKAIKMWEEKDTINYLVSAFKDSQDLVIGDVLKKLPGIKVEESGQISYKGKPINKFYIENMDMLQGRYGLATNNISASDISVIQVLENHQTIKALDKIRFSNDAAINLKMREDKKGIFGITAILGAGIDSKFLRQGELTGMFTSKTHQHLSTVKTNNSGMDINKELRSFTAETPIGELQMTYIQQPALPAIRFERYNFNNTHAATANNLFKLKKKGEVSANVIFCRNESRMHGFSHTSYLLPGEETQTIAEDISAQETTNNLEGEFLYNQNDEKSYFNNLLRVSTNWNDNRGNVLTEQHIGQRLSDKSFSANNTIHWIKRGESERGIELVSETAFRTQPHHLIVTPGLYPDLFNGGDDYASLRQNVQGDAFTSRNHLSLLSAMMIGNVKLNPGAYTRVKYRKLRSDFEVADNSSVPQSIDDVLMRNDISLIQLNGGIFLEVAYHTSSFKLNIYLPAAYQYTTIDNRLSGNGSLHKGKTYIQPSLTAKYNFTARLEVSVNGFRQIQTPEINTLYTGYILQNYRNINRYETQLFDTDNLGGSLNFAYKNVLNMFFAGGGISYNCYRRDGIYGQTFDGQLTVTQLVMRPNNGNSLAVNGRISKGIDWNMLVFSADVSGGKSKSEQLRQESFVRYNSRWVNADASVNIKPAQWLTCEYKMSWGRSWGSVSTGETFPAIQSLNHRAMVNISLPLDMALYTTFEHYYHNTSNYKKDFSLADMGLTYTYRGARFSLDWTNILNTSKYISTSYSALNTYYSEYDIRPAAVMLKVGFKLL